METRILYPCDYKRSCHIARLIVVDSYTNQFADKRRAAGGSIAKHQPKTLWKKQHISSICIGLLNVFYCSLIYPSFWLMLLLLHTFTWMNVKVFYLLSLFSTTLNPFAFTPPYLFHLWRLHKKWYTLYCIFRHYVIWEDLRTLIVSLTLPLNLNQKMQIL